LIRTGEDWWANKHLLTLPGYLAGNPDSDHPVEKIANLRPLFLQDIKLFHLVIWPSPCKVQKR